MYIHENCCRFIFMNCIFRSVLFQNAFVFSIKHKSNQLLTILLQVIASISQSRLINIIYTPILHFYFSHIFSTVLGNPGSTMINSCFISYTSPPLEDTAVPMLVYRLSLQKGISTPHRAQNYTALTRM